MLPSGIVDNTSREEQNFVENDGWKSILRRRMPKHFTCVARCATASRLDLGEASGSSKQHMCPGSETWGNNGGPCGGSFMN